MTYEQAIQYLFGLQPIGIKFGLQNTLTLLKQFSDPHQKIKTIHVAGTNGKGSVCSMLFSILQTAGFKVGVYTSPHLIEFSERICINGTPISKNEIIGLTERIQWAIGKGDFQGTHPTFFEVVTVMALVYFQEQDVDLAILETGMGGRLDATNVVCPLLAIITSIDLEHQQYLGDSLDKIAKEKAGIIKDGVPVVVGPCQEDVYQIFEEIGRQKRAPVIKALSSLHIRKSHQDFSGQRFEVFIPGFDAPQLFTICMLGQHQIQNALIALTAILKLNELLPPSIAISQMVKGLASAKWPARIEIYKTQPLMIIDGAHNPSSINQLVLFLEELSYAKLILVFGVMKDKEIERICEKIFSLASHIILTRPNMPRAASPEEIMDLVSEKFLVDKSMISIAPTVGEAISSAREIAEENDVICITGSLFLAGEAKAIIEKKKR